MKDEHDEPVWDDGPADEEDEEEGEEEGEEAEEKEAEEEEAPAAEEEEAEDAVKAPDRVAEKEEKAGMETARDTPAKLAVKVEVRSGSTARVAPAMTDKSFGSGAASAAAPAKPKPGTTPVAKAAGTMRQAEANLQAVMSRTAKAGSLGAPIGAPVRNGDSYYLPPKAKAAQAAPGDHRPQSSAWHRPQAAARGNRVAGVAVPPRGVWFMQRMVHPLPQSARAPKRPAFRHRIQ